MPSFLQHPSLSRHQLAFFTPGKLPSSAFILNWNCHPNISIVPSEECPLKIQLTLANLKSLNTPLDFPPAIHLLFICVERV